MLTKKNNQQADKQGRVISNALDIQEGPKKAVGLGALTQEKVDLWAKTIREWDDNDPSFFCLPKFVSVVAEKL